MVKDLADGPKEDSAWDVMADNQPVILNPKKEEEPEKTLECKYCGHYPCGCGG